MTTPVLITGYEYGVATLTANGGGLVNTINGSGMSVQSSIKYSGSYALKTVAASSYGWLTYTLSTPTHITAHVRVYFATLFSSSGAVIYPSITAGTTISVRYNQATGYFSLYNGSTYVDTNVAPTTGTWYLIQADWDCATGTTTGKLKINGGGEYTHSISQTATTFTNINVGIGSTMTSGEVYHDDLIVSTTSGDYPIPSSAVVGLSPTSDGTHTNTANTVEFQDGTDIVQATTDAYTAVNSVPIGDATKYIRQAATGAYYAELKFTTDKTNIIGAIALLAYKAAGTSADTGACYWIDEDAVQTTIWGNPTTRADYSESSNFYKRAVLPVTAGGWDAAAIIAGKIRCGNSNDVTPNPYWLDLMIELAYQLAAGTPLIVYDSVQAQTVDGTVLTQHNILDVDDTVQLQNSDNIFLAQHNILSVQSATQLQNAESKFLGVGLRVADAIHGQTAESKSLLQHNILAVQNAQQLQNSALVTLAQHNILVVQNATQLQNSDNISLLQHVILAVQNATQLQNSSNVSLTQHNILSVDNATQLQNSGYLNLIQHNILSVYSAVQSMNSDNLIVVYHPMGGIMLIVQDSTQGQTADKINLLQHNILAVQNASQLQNSDLVNLTQHNILLIQNAIQLQNSDLVNLLQHNILTVQNAQQLQNAGSVNLTQHNLLSVNNATQAQNSDYFNLIQHNILKIDNAVHGVSSDNLIIVYHPSSGIVLVVQDSTLGQTAGSVALTQHNVLLVDNATHLQTSSTVGLTQHNYLVVYDSTQPQVSDNLYLIYHPSGYVPVQVYIELKRLLNTSTYIMKELPILTKLYELLNINTKDIETIDKIQTITGDLEISTLVSKDTGIVH